MYEFQIAAMKQAHETERQLIREHYEKEIKKQEEHYEHRLKQCEMELKTQAEHYEHRLEDKREIIAAKDSEKNWFKWVCIICVVIFSHYVLQNLPTLTLVGLDFKRDYI